MNALLMWTSLLLGVLPRSSLTEWAAHFPKGRSRADEFAAEHGLINAGEIIPDSNCFHFLAPFHKRHKRHASHDESIKKALKHADVAWFTEQKANIRVKRGDDEYVRFSKAINDPYWKDMWYLNRGGGMHMNVASAWAQGISGKGVAVTILDDGLEKSHPDLLRNYDPLASTDINDNDSDPNPRYDFSDSNRHGTRCAGQVAASPNNSVCSIGIAFNAQIGGIRMLDGQVSQVMYAI